MEDNKPTESQEPQLSTDQLYLQDLFQKAENGDIATDQKVLIEMLAKSEAGIANTVKEGNTLERQIYEMQQRLQEFKDAVNNERGKARGLAEALLTIRDENSETKVKEAEDNKTNEPEEKVETKPDETESA